MRRVEAEPDPCLQPRGEGIAERPELLNRAPQSRASTRRALDQDAHVSWDGTQTLGVAARVAVEPRRAVVDVVAGVRHHPGDAQRPRALQLARERADALRSQG